MFHGTVMHGKYFNNVNTEIFFDKNLDGVITIEYKGIKGDPIVFCTEYIIQYPFMGKMCELVE